MVCTMATRAGSSCREIFKALTSVSGVGVPVPPPDKKDKARVIVLQREAAAGGGGAASAPSSADMPQVCVWRRRG